MNHVRQSQIPPLILLFGIRAEMQYGHNIQTAAVIARKKLRQNPSYYHQALKRMRRSDASTRDRVESLLMSALLIAAGQHDAID